MTNQEGLILVEDLTRRFGERLAVDRLSFEARPGEIVGLLGPNGAGKTTTLRMLAGIIAPTSGSATVGGIDPAREPERVHEAIGLLTESPGFYERITAERNLAYFAGFYSGLDARAAARRGLESMGLLDRASDRVGTFSKGMKQRLALARTLLHQPRVLFLDEPTAGLDPEAAKALRELIVELKHEGRGILLSTHNLSEAEQICDRIAVFRTRLIALDTAEALRERQFAPHVNVRLVEVSESLLEALTREPYVLEARRGDARGSLSVRLKAIDQDRPRLVARLVELGAQVLEVREAERSLEDVYLSLVQEEER
jgi:ABC-2 type transport system ATP-binding protein